MWKLVSILVCLAAAPARAQTTDMPGVPLTLAEAERRALEKNPSVADARLGTAAADYVVAEQRAVYAPTFSASVAQRSQATPATSQLAGGQRQVSNDAASYSTGLSQVLPRGGGRIEVDFTGNRTATSNTFSTYNPSFSSSLTVSITQPLLRGLRFDGNRAEIAQADIARSIADIELRRRIATTLAGVRRAYWQLLYAGGVLDTAKTSEALAQRQVDDNRRRAELGTVAAIDVLESEAEVASRHEAVVKAEGNWRAAQIALKQLIVSSTSDPIWDVPILPVDSPAEGVRSIDVSQGIANAVANRTDLAVAGQQRQSADTALRLLGEERKPSADIVATYALSGVGGTQILRQPGALGSDIVGTVPGGYLDVLRSIGGFDFPTWTIGLSFTVPLGPNAADAAYARAAVERRQADVRIEALELQVAAEVTRAAEQVRSAEEQVRSAAVARQLAQKRVDAEEARRAAGLATTFLVLQAQRDLAAARTNELRAQLDYRTALVEYDLAQEAS